jgi:beta-lactamase class D
MREWVHKLGYGNEDIRGGVDLFWLQGALRISAREQVDFLRRLAEGELPMTQRSQRLVRRALIVEKTPAYTLHAKSGTTESGRNAIHWWVGWVEKKGRLAGCFAMNFAPNKDTKYEDRIAIGRAILEEQAILPRKPAIS